MTTGKGRYERQNERTELWTRMNETLSDEFERAEISLTEALDPQVLPELVQGCNAIFESNTQAFREVAVGCLLTRIHEPAKNIRFPYVSQTPDAFNGRTLDERVVNPFLRSRSIPCSTGPYLNVFRRQAKFTEEQSAGIRDKQGFSGLLKVIDVAEQQTNAPELRNYLKYLLYRFVQLREEANIELLLLERISLNQYNRLVVGLLSRPSGGFFPVALVVATIEAIRETFSLDWIVDYQNINVADAASGVTGDITIRSNGMTVMVIEVTERRVEMERLQRTFVDKIAGSMSDYLFMVHLQSIEQSVKEQTERYFAQGYDINFVDVVEWITNTLVSLGAKGRRVFQNTIVDLLSATKIPKALKVAWNEEIQKVI